MLHSLIVDDFLQDFARWREWLDAATFGDIASAVDGVIYPHICMELPDELRGEIRYKLQAFTGLERINHLFARMSSAGVRPPHWAHNDASMGRWSCMLYVNRPEHCEGGTLLLKHHHYGMDVPHDAWLEDTNRPGMWIETFNCPMVSNRAFVFPAEKWHAAMPRDGFGLSPPDARLVVTAFFD